MVGLGRFTMIAPDPRMQSAAERKCAPSQRLEHPRGKSTGDSSLDGSRSERRGPPGVLASRPVLRCASRIRDEAAVRKGAVYLTGRLVRTASDFQAARRSDAKRVTKRTNCDVCDVGRIHAAPPGLPEVRLTTCGLLPTEAAESCAVGFRQKNTSRLERARQSSGPGPTARLARPRQMPKAVDLSF